MAPPDRDPPAHWRRALAGRRVLVTGHTGFKGSWLALWLARLGAEVTGYSLPPPTEPSHFQAAGVADLLADDRRGDIRAPALAEAVAACDPDVVFHLAAQPILRLSLRQPRETFDVNVSGTAAVLDAVRARGRPCVVIVVTSDKCYRNEGQPWGFREIDPLGGHDPYSASKAAAELVVESYRASFFPPADLGTHGVAVASVRAGNVVGGGDWAAERIVPDAVRALAAGEDLVVRNPAATRPWQHVLEPLAGYLTLAARLLTDPEPGLAGAFNFGPLTSEEATVAELADALVAGWGSGRWVAAPDAGRPNVEATTLRIGIDKAVLTLGWRPRWALGETLARIVAWYRRYYDDPSASIRPASLGDIEAYEAALRR